MFAQRCLGSPELRLGKEQNMFKNREKKKYIYIYRKSASRFLRGTVLNTLKQSRINIMRGKKGRNYISHIYIYI